MLSIILTTLLSKEETMRPAGSTVQAYWRNLGKILIRNIFFFIVFILYIIV